MVEELDRREFLAIASASGIAAVAGFSTTFPVDEGVEVPEGQVGGPGGGGFGVADGVEPVFILASDSTDYQNHEPDGPTLYLVESGQYQGLRYHEP